MKRIVIVNTLLLGEECLKDFTCYLKKRLLEDKYYLQVEVIASADFRLMNQVSSIADAFGYNIPCEYRYCLKTNPDDTENFLNKFSVSVKGTQERVFCSRYDRIIGIVHYPEKEIENFFERLNIPSSKESVEIPFFIGEKLCI